MRDSKRVKNTSFLRQRTVTALHEDFNSKMELGGTLLVQTCRYGKLRRQDALLAGNDKARLAYLRIALDRAWSMLTSSYVAHAPRRFPTGLWDVAHSSWVITLHGKKGYFWICYYPEIGSILPIEFEDFSRGEQHGVRGIAATLLLLQSLSKNMHEDVLQQEITALEETMEAQHPRAVKAARNWLKRINQEEGATKTATNYSIDTEVAATA